MPSINLLPWRDERRKQRNQEFFVMLGLAAVGAVLLAGLSFMFFDSGLGFQQQRNTRLESEIGVLDRKIKEISDIEKDKARLLSKMQVVQQLQSHRTTIVHLFDEVVQAMPEGVTLTNIARKGDLMILSGYAESNARVSALMRNLEASDWLTSPKLGSITRQENSGRIVSNFTLEVKQVNPSVTEDAESA
ncbi:MAG TPA: pilus assembly protein PilN [Gammaproteobacteria bacterium]|nr:pilus assembly protein PilN [Gammaproteobacteria bacterium]